MNLLAPPSAAILCPFAMLSAGCSTESFTWVDGGSHRYLSCGSICAEDGSLVVSQQANTDGNFGPVKATAQNCGSRAP